jgi:hypothetical protein
MDEGPVKRLGLGRHDNLVPVEPSPIRHPVRLATAVGAVALLVGSVLPWVTYSIDSVSNSINGIQGETWGIYVIGLAIGLVVVLSMRLIAESSYRPLQLLPGVLGLAGLAVYYNVQVEAQQLADNFRNTGYQVSLGPGLDVLLLASLVCAVGGVASTVVTWSANPPPPRVARAATSSDWQGCGDFAAELVVGTLVCAGCAFLGAVVAVAVTADAPVTPELVVVMVIVGILTGGVLTDRFWRKFVHRR